MSPVGCTPSEQYLDIRLTYPFMCLSENNVMMVISALLTEQTILFVSSLHPMLMYVIQCSLSYVYPLVWRHSLVPILPHDLLEVLDGKCVCVCECGWVQVWLCVCNKNRGV